MPERAYLSIGSNVGDREKNLYDALAAIAKEIGRIEVSSVYETHPMYVEEQPLFLNTICRTETSLMPLELLDATQQIETALGRRREAGQKNGPRTIDIDIVLYGNLIIQETRLSIPHPSIHERKFVLVPLLELEPDIVDPKSGQKYAKSLEALGEQGIYYFTLNRYSLQDHGG